MKCGDYTTVQGPAISKTSHDTHKHGAGGVHAQKTFRRRVELLSGI